jgi:hypothetical protein
VKPDQRAGCRDVLAVGKEVEIRRAPKLLDGCSVTPHVCTSLSHLASYCAAAGSTAAVRWSWLFPFTIN